ncbi:apoptosis-linked protein [Cokeromyces recurvatus]|uniref:apoptosis-linked protein n=1 Tax=Cokeromyces recurvatus TaxID=90255 RepID=UPI00221F2812|nr:apoptosis-linked protein [Cokeromyces recurvatus]KAI7905220.1 apoptosis-linked protein [Cokeromyces recurvatus]
MSSTTTNSYNPSLQRSNTFTPMVNKREQYLWSVFRKVDADNSGYITVNELQAALVNGDWSPFNIETVRLMVSIFDTDNNGCIDFREFQGLWKYIEDWSECFKKFDLDNSGSIDRYEMSHALRTFGFNVSDRFVGILIQIFDKYGHGNITFDNFVQACVILSTLTKLFRARDYEGRGSIIINYEDFMTMIISSRPNMKGS